jgi:hypothetical protein
MDFPRRISKVISQSWAVPGVFDWAVKINQAAAMPQYSDESAW